MAGDISNTFTLPTLAVIYLAALGTVVIQHFAKLSFGFIGFLAWLIVIIGSIAFVIAMFTHIFGR